VKVGFGPWAALRLVCATAAPPQLPVIEWKSAGAETGQLQTNRSDLVANISLRSFEQMIERTFGSIEH
jgi:hypothetical protein